MCALIDHQEFSKCNNCFFFRSARPGLEPERPAAAPLSSSTSLGWEMIKKIKENREEEKFSFKGEVHQSNGTVWPAWWDVRRHFKANILKRWWLNWDEILSDWYCVTFHPGRLTWERSQNSCLPRTCNRPRFRKCHLRSVLLENLSIEAKFRCPQPREGVKNCFTGRGWVHPIWIDFRKNVFWHRPLLLSY